MMTRCDDSLFITNELPVNIGEVRVSVDEFMSYQCLPIKFPGMNIPIKEERLNVFDKILAYIYRDFCDVYGYEKYLDSYVYLTAKHRRVSPDCSMNRPGYHIDGFGETDVMNYIWSNCFPTIFNKGSFNISLDDKLSLLDMDKQADKENEVTYPNYSILRLNNSVIHKVAPVTNECNRAFVKVTFSKLRYNLAGNSHNYLLDYKWNMVKRDIDRNVQHKVVKQ